MFNFCRSLVLDVNTTMWTIDTENRNKWIKNPTSVALGNKIKDKTNSSDKIKVGPSSKN